MAEIEVRRTNADQLVFECEVVVSDGTERSTHRVTVDPAYLDRLGGPNEDPEHFVTRCFEFLLAREPKESILDTFDVSVIARYFPEFEKEIAG